MRYFKVSEFDDYSKMDAKLICALDEFRHLTRSPVFLSPAPGAQWRRDNTSSQHNINAHNQSRAIDLFPSCSLWYAFLTAMSVPEIIGVGIYPHWQFGTLNYGMHLDVREGVNKIVWWKNKDNIYKTIHSTSGFEVLLHEFNQ